MNTIFHVCHLGFLLLAIRNFSLAGILRLISLSLVAGSRSEGNLSVIKDIPLSYLRKLIGDVRNKEYMNESWQSCYKRTNSGKLVRQASTAVCILNEMVFGLSDQAVDNMKSWPLSLANSDYVIDSICRELFHLYLNPHVPSVLAAILSYIGVAHQLPLMEEHMRSISQELEILGRHQHPELTTSFLKVEVILDYVVTYFILRQWQKLQRLQKLEACSLPSQAEAYHKHVESELSNLERKTMNRVDDVDHSSLEDNANKYKEQLEVVFFKLKEIKSYIRTVGSISISCITTATPLLSSLKQTTCLIALDIVEDGIVAGDKNQGDTLDAENDGTDKNRLLPVMNKIRLFLIACIRNRKPLVRTLSLVSAGSIVVSAGSASFLLVGLDFLPWSRVKSLDLPITLPDNRIWALLDAPTVGSRMRSFFPEITANNFEIKAGLMYLGPTQAIFLENDKEVPHAQSHTEIPLPCFDPIVAFYISDLNSNFGESDVHYCFEEADAFLALDDNEYSVWGGVGGSLYKMLLGENCPVGIIIKSDQLPVKLYHHLEQEKASAS
ncbi:hypothetical protein Tco_1109986 [Tanacetum coccineum]|uniref:Uncharacterized protein n=1 Tax=Tanacetum coccineum TaxID=301880 RepID=A0ABQ5IHP0_9ASTR